MKKKSWIFIMCVVFICVVGIMILAVLSKPDETQKNREENSVLKEEEHVPDVDNTDETELIPEVAEDESKTDNSTNGNSTVKDDIVTDHTTTNTDKQSGENQMEEDADKENAEERIESSEPIELPFVPYEGEN